MESNEHYQRNFANPVLINALRREQQVWSFIHFQRIVQWKRNIREIFDFSREQNVKLTLTMENDSRVHRDIYLLTKERRTYADFPNFPALWLYSDCRCIPTRVPELNSHHEETRRDFTRRLALLNPTSSYRDYNESRYLGSKFFSHNKASYSPYNAAYFVSSSTIFAVTIVKAFVRSFSVGKSEF